MYRQSGVLRCLGYARRARVQRVTLLPASRIQLCQEPCGWPANNNKNDLTRSEFRHQQSSEAVSWAIFWWYLTNHALGVQRCNFRRLGDLQIKVIYVLSQYLLGLMIMRHGNLAVSSCICSCCLMFIPIWKVSNDTGIASGIELITHALPSIASRQRISNNFSSLLVIAICWSFQLHSLFATLAFLFNKPEWNSGVWKLVRLALSGAIPLYFAFIFFSFLTNNVFWVCASVTSG